MKTFSHDRRAAQAGNLRRYLLACLLAASSLYGESILFIGNPITTGEGSVLKDYHPEGVTELNGGKAGGIPALFKTFTVEAGLNYAVSAETANRAGLDFHVTNKANLIGQPWDHVVMHGFSSLDEKHPGNPDLLIRSTKEAVTILAAKNPNVDVWLMATWPIVRLTNLGDGPWSGKSVEAMASDIRSAYDRAATNAGHVHGVIAVGESWTRAFQTGVAGANPFDGIPAG